MNKIKLYDIHGISAEENFKTLLTSDEKYFYWDNGKFVNYTNGDIVFWINRSKKIALCTIVDSTNIKPLFKNGKNIISDQKYNVSAIAQSADRFEIFYRFKVIKKIDIPQNWNYTNTSTFRQQNMAIKLLEENINEPDKKIEKINDLEKLFSEGDAFNLLEEAKRFLSDEAPMDSSKKRNVWFVCQGDSYVKGNGKKYLWAPQKDKTGKKQSYWENMLKVKVGDIIFNYADGIRGVSIAKSDGYISDNPVSGSRWGNAGYRVDIDLTELSKTINHKELQIKKDQFAKLLQNENSPFNINGGVKQGYLFVFSQNAGRLVREIYGGKFGNKEIDDFFDQLIINPINNPINSMNKNILNAIKTKPFILLAGLSGTGKSRLVRTLAYQTCSDEELRKDVRKPGNFELIPVRPNWHDSTELMGYVSRINGEKYIVTSFLKFIAKAWKYPTVPFFLCLDEMNLAPVEQYFAEYLSIIETRANHNGEMSSDYLITKSNFENQGLYNQILQELGITGDDNFKEGISIPNNLVVMGTVNMDETTHSFSRKVLDRAMTFEMNVVDLNVGLDENKNDWSYPNEFIPNEQVLGKFAEGSEVVNKFTESKQILEYLENLNKKLEDTPFKIAYRARDEFLIYCYCCSLAEKKPANWLNIALDEMTSMKILSRIEGDEGRTGDVLLKLQQLMNDDFKISLAKLKEMQKRLEKSGYTSFWL